MIHPSTFVALRLLCPLIIGILIYQYLANPIYFLILFPLFYFYYTFLSKYFFEHKKNIIFSSLIYSATILLSFFNCLNKDMSRKKDFFVPQDFNFQDQLLLEVLAPGIPKSNSVLYQCKIIAALTHKNNFIARSGKLYLYTNKTETPHFNRYDKIVIPNQIQIPRLINNPGAFEYKNYLKSEGFDYTCFFQTDSIIKLNAHSNSHPFLSFTLKLDAFRKKCINYLKASLSKESFSIATALLTGTKIYVESDLKNLYASNGVMHIMAISGLHVGLIFLILNFAMRFFGTDWISKTIKLMLILICLWSYALFSGNSSSVCRACLMLTLYCFAKFNYFQLNNINIIFSSAFMLLIMDPQLLFKLGFLLSYAAVISILIIYQPIYKLLEGRFSLKNKIYSLTSVSIAAQIGTGPLAAQYFYFFPIGFLPANLIAVPAASFILIFGIILLVCCFIFPQVAFIPAILLDQGIQLLNYILIIINWFGNFNPKFFVHPTLTIILIYLILMLIIAWVKFMNKFLFRLVLILTLSLFGIYSFHKVLHLKQNKLVVYSDKKNLLIHQFYGKNLIEIYNNAIDSMHFSLIESDARRYFHVPENQKTIKIGTHNHFILNNLDLVILDRQKFNSQIQNLSNSKSLKLILHQDPYFETNQLYHKWEEIEIILSSCSKAYCKRIKYAIEETDFKLYNINMLGAYQLNLN